LISKGYIIKQANDDADTTIVNMEITMVQNKFVIVVGQDIELQVLLIVVTPVQNQVIFLKPGNEIKEKNVFYSRYSKV